MKKKILLFATVLSYFLGTAQMSVQKYDGTLIHNGDVFEYSTADTEDSMLKFSVHNTSANQPILVKILCESVTNSNGQNFEFCFGGNCMPFVIVGQNYPPSGFEIAAGSNSGDSDHFWNQSPVSTTGQYPMDFVFKVYQVDALGTELGDPVRLTYRYNGALGVKDNELSALFSLKNTLVKEDLKIVGKEAGSLTVSDLSGKNVFTSGLAKGENTVNLQKLQPGVYIVTMKSAAGHTSSAKILKK